MFKPAPGLWVDANQAQRLKSLVASGKTPQKMVLRARIILLAGRASPTTRSRRGWAPVARRSCSGGADFSDRRAGADEGCATAGAQEGRGPRGNQASGGDDAAHDAAGGDALEHADHGPAHGLSRMTVQRIWRQHGLQPHRVETFKLSRDPQFVEKLRDVVGLYLDPPDKALILSVDEKSQIQALDRTQPLLPLRRGRAADPRLQAAWDHDLVCRAVPAGWPSHRAVPAAPSEPGVHPVLAHGGSRDARGLDLHLIVDNSSTHKSPPVKRWLTRHPRFHLHFTPTSSSWLNMVERWFGEITQKRIRRGGFRSVKELVVAITEYLHEYNQAPNGSSGPRMRT